MFKLFSGMVIGSLITMVLLGGAPAANKVLQNTQTIFDTQYAQASGPALAGYLLIFLILILIHLSTSTTKQSTQTALAIKKLRRYHSRHQ